MRGAAMTPLQRYERDLRREDFVEDPAQRAVAEKLEGLYRRLVAADAKDARWRGFIPRRWRGLQWRRRFLFWRRGQAAPVRGLYLWGGVGRGKTYLADAFHDCLPFPRKRRMHFHRFMQRVHTELRGLQGRKNPLAIVADRIAGDARVLCFDEFFVSDITDAMLLGGLLAALFERGVALVATSNIPPDELYRDGLQRQRFLPAIELIKRHTEVVNLDDGADYRLRALERAELYHWPLDDAAHASLRRSFRALAPEGERQREPLDINGRRLRPRRTADDVVWFDFSELCAAPRSQNDYIELARLYHTVLLGGVPQLSAAADDAARRFISLVDEFYDRNVKLILSAAAPLSDLYTGTRLAFEFQRTASRLQEMQSRDYLSRSHRP